MKSRYLILFIVCFLLMSPAILFAGGKKFVDFDGDGFNDNIIDMDNNGIPDKFQSKVKEVASTGSFSFSPSSLFGDENKSTIKLTLSEKFSLSRFKCRLLSKCRSDFESDFNTGINVSASSGGGCAGGVCF